MTHRQALDGTQEQREEKGSEKFSLNSALYKLHLFDLSKNFPPPPGSHDSFQY